MLIWQNLGEFLQHLRVLPCCNDGQGNMVGTCQLGSGEFPAEIDRSCCFYLQVF